MRVPSASAGLAAALIGFAATLGVGRDALLADSGIAAADLHDPDGRIPLDRYVRLVRAATTLAGDPAFPLRFGAAIDLEEISIVGLIGRASRNMTEALEQLNRYGRLVVEVALEGHDRFANEIDSQGIWMTDRRADPNAFCELTEITFARMICGVRSFAPQLRVHAIEVTHPAPGHAAEYERILGAPVRFGASRNAYRIDPDWLTLELAMEPPYVFAALSSHAEALLAKLDADDGLAARVEARILSRLHTGRADIAGIAADLGMSRQTLYRRLKAEGTSYAAILDDLRKRLARDYIGNGRVSVNQTTYLLGFSDPAAFSRAFKRWTGASPREFRNRAGSACA